MQYWQGRELFDLGAGYFQAYTLHFNITKKAEFFLRETTCRSERILFCYD